MTEFEICSSFRGCANRKNQIDIIRDMSTLSKNKIFNILLSNGLITTEDSDYEALAKYCEPSKSINKQKSKSRTKSANKQCEIKNTKNEIRRATLDKSINLDKSISFIRGQKFIGVPTSEIAENLGVSNSDFNRFYELMKQENGEFSFIDKQITLGQIKSNLEKIENYSSYIESFIECGMYASIQEVLDKQRELVSESKMLIKSMYKTNNIVA